LTGRGRTPASLLGGVGGGVGSWRASTLLDNHHPESGSNPLVRAPLAEIQRGVYGKVTWQF